MFQRTFPLRPNFLLRRKYLGMCGVKQSIFIILRLIKGLGDSADVGNTMWVASESFHTTFCYTGIGPSALGRSLRGWGCASVAGAGHTRSGESRPTYYLSYVLDSTLWLLPTSDSPRTLILTQFHLQA